MYQFTKDCLTGIETIDEEHRQLFKMINEAFELLKDETATAISAKNLMLALKRYAKTHFVHEEEYMEQIKDPELEMQKKEHAQFTRKLNEFPANISDDAEGKKILEEMLEYLTHWLYHHILGSDIMIGKMKPLEEEDPFAFTEKYRTGITLIDHEHKRLFEIIKETNDLTNEILFNDKFDDIQNILAELKDYTVMHFNDEENYMESMQYEGLAAQRYAHESFIDKINEVNLDEVDGDQQGYLKELIDFLLGWLINHILKMDKQIPAKK